MLTKSSKTKPKRKGGSSESWTAKENKFITGLYNGSFWRKSKGGQQSEKKLSPAIKKKIAGMAQLYLSEMEEMSRNGGAPDLKWRPPVPMFPEYYEGMDFKKEDAEFQKKLKEWKKEDDELFKREVEEKENFANRLRAEHAEEKKRRKEREIEEEREREEREREHERKREREREREIEKSREFELELFLLSGGPSPEEVQARLERLPNPTPIPAAVRVEIERYTQMALGLGLLKKPVSSTTTPAAIQAKLERYTQRVRALKEQVSSTPTPAAVQAALEQYTNPTPTPAAVQAELERYTQMARAQRPAQTNLAAVKTEVPTPSPASGLRQEAYNYVVGSQPAQSYLGSVGSFLSSAAASAAAYASSAASSAAAYATSIAAYISTGLSTAMTSASSLILSTPGLAFLSVAAVAALGYAMYKYAKSPAAAQDRLAKSLRAQIRRIEAFMRELYEFVRKSNQANNRDLVQYLQKASEDAIEIKQLIMNVPDEQEPLQAAEMLGSLTTIETNLRVMPAKIKEMALMALMAQN